MSVAPSSNVSVARAKLVDYLLNVDHPQGSAKARFFLGHGFAPADPQVLADALHDHLAAPTSDVTTAPHPRGYGHSLVVTGPMAMPNGRTEAVKTIWLLHPDGKTITFTSAYPDD